MVTSLNVVKPVVECTIYGQILTAAPLVQYPPEVHWIEKGCLQFDQEGTILYVGERISSLPEGHGKVLDFGEQIILPGFIDTHIHFLQFDMIGAYAGELLDWLEQQTFPHENRWMSHETDIKLEQAADLFINQLILNGTTLACIYGPSLVRPTEILLQKIWERGIRAIIGKTSMDRHAPDGLLHEKDKDLESQEQLILKWHQKDQRNRLFYALTPRFAPSCSDHLMRGLGDLNEKFSDLYIQTHYAETLEEISWVRSLYPKHKDYLDVYESFGLIGHKTILGHGIHTNHGERKVLKERRAVLAHCPSSNLFLGSGLFPASHYRQDEICIALGTDIGAGTSFSMWKTMGEAYKVAKLRGDDFKPTDLFYTATQGAASALGLDHVTGSLTEGKKADFQIINPSKNLLLRRRLTQVESIEQMIFALIHHCDDRCVEQVYVDGKELLFPTKRSLI